MRAFGAVGQGVASSVTAVRQLMGKNSYFLPASPILTFWGSVPKNSRKFFSFYHPWSYVEQIGENASESPKPRVSEASLGY